MRPRFNLNKWKKKKEEETEKKMKEKKKEEKDKYKKYFLKFNMEYINLYSWQKL